MNQISALNNTLEVDIALNKETRLYQTRDFSLRQQLSLL